MNLADFLYDFMRFPQFRTLNAQFVLDVTPQSLVIKRNTEGAYCDVHFSKELFYPYIRPVFLIAPDIITISPNFRLLLHETRQPEQMTEALAADADTIAAAAAAAAATAATFVARPILPNVTRSFRLTSEMITSTHAPKFECLDKTMRVIGRVNDCGLDERDDRAALLEMSKTEMEERDIKRRKVDKETCSMKTTKQCYDTRGRALLDVQPVDISFETPPATPMTPAPTVLIGAETTTSEQQYMDIAGALEPQGSGNLDRDVVAQQNKVFTLPDNDFKDLLSWINARPALLKDLQLPEGMTVNTLKDYIRNNLPSVEHISEVHDHFKQLDETLQQFRNLGP